MRPFEVGVVLVTGQVGAERVTARWTEIRDLALQAEALGFDTVWAPDELLWRPKDRPQMGFWDGIAMLGAIAAVTSRIKVGSWVLSALHRNPGIIAKAAETLDEISGGRFVFGLGAGHEWPGQAHAFGLPEDHIYPRFEEALDVIVPLLREGRADLDGTYHAAHDLDHVPVGPRAGRIPLMIGGHGPKGMRHAARLADIWSCYAEKRSSAEELAPKVAAFEAACADVGRDPLSIGRSAGVEVAPIADDGRDGRPAPGGADDALSDAITGPPEGIADALRALGALGFTQIECALNPQTPSSLETLSKTLRLLETA